MIHHPRFSVLFVCLGNICRSPLAEAAFRLEAELAGLDLHVDSAGTGSWHVDQPPDRRAQAVALRHGCDIAGYRARQLEPDDFLRFGHVFVMDQDNLAEARRIMPPGALAEPRLLLDLVPGWQGNPVADPYFGDDSGFDRTWQEVSTAAVKLVARFIEQG